MCFKNLEGKLGRESPKRTISINSGIELLQMVSKPDTGRCANGDAGPLRGVDYEISRQFERGTNIFYNLSLVDAF